MGHVVLSALEDPRKHVPKGALPEMLGEPGHLVSHFETKAEIEARWQRVHPAKPHAPYKRSKVVSSLLL